MKTLKHLFTALLLLYSIAASAQQFEVDGIYYKVTNSTNKTVEVTSGTNKYTGSVVIPESVTYNDVTYCVTSISSYSFRDCSSLTSVEIPNSVTSIRSGAFENCMGLTKIVIGNGVKTVYNYAFKNCTGLLSVHINDLAAWCDIDFNSPSDNPLSIARNLYLNNKLLTDLVIPEGVTEIKDYAFYGCSGLTSVEIPNGVTSIGHSAFRNSSSLTGNLVIPNSVTSLGEYAFYDCKGFTSLSIGNGVTIVGSNVFGGCSGLTSVVIPDNVTSIGERAFYCCYSLASLTIGNGVESIGKAAFYHCNALTNIEIPNSVISIGESAFYDCFGLISVVIGNGVTSIGRDAFNNCKSLKGRLEIPNSVVTIGASAFYGCGGITSIVIPNSVQSIHGYAFYGCGIKEVYISDIGAWCNIVFGDREANPLSTAKILYLNGEVLTDLVIPDGVTKINNFAFYNCSSITGALVIPKGIASIGEHAFYNCIGLSNIEIPNSVTSIGSNAFYNINALFEFISEEPASVGSSVFHAGAIFAVPDVAVDSYKTAWSSYAAQITGKSEAFVVVDVKAMEASSAIMERIGIDKMAAIVKLTVRGSINSYDVIQFRDKMPMLRELDLGEATVVASDKAFYNGNSTKDNDLGAYAFYSLSKLNYVKLPKDLVTIGSYMFFGCSSLRELEIPAKVQDIRGYAFNKTTSLQKITIPAGVKIVGNSAFVESGIKSITLPNGLEIIGEWAFRDCKSLNEAKLPPTLKSIKAYAFYNCSSLEEIRIPSSVISIGSSAFAGCSNLAKVYTYTVEPTAIQESTFSTFQTATLYVPSFSFSNYYWDDGWKRFLNLAEFNEPYEYFYVNNDCVLNDDTGYIEGVEGENPDADINAGGGIIIEGEQGDDEIPNQSLGDVNVGSDGEGTSGSIIGDNNLHIDDLHIKINVKGGRWYFFAFPFDIFFEDITMENSSDYVFRYYDGEERAQNGKGGWKDINENHLKAARGYIFQCSANDVLVLNIEDVKFKKEDKYNELVAHVSDNLKDASWNFTGNPYLSYYDMADMDYTAPVTVWDGEKYVAIRPGDDDYHFAPYEAFFVQKPEGQDAIGFDGEEQMTKNQSNKQKEKQAAARRARGIDPERLLINLVLGNGTSDDRTRIVFNERQSLGYETSCDATKFETAGVTQLYTIGSDKVHYAINERPADNGRVVLGYTAPTAGFYTIEAQRMDAEVYVKDFKTGTLHNLKDGAYSFSTDAGTFNDRFEILLKGTAPGTTGIDEVKGENGNVKTEIYDLQGRKMQDAENGIYIINGEKVVK